MAKRVLGLALSAVVGTACAGGEPAGNAHMPAPDGFGQLETAPALFRGGVDEQGREFFLNGQRARNGKLNLTASNGFFDSGACVATGESALPRVGDNHLIAKNFACLGRWNKTGRSLRWHVWLPRAGKVRVNVHLRVDGAQAGSALNVAFAGQSRTVRTAASEAAKAQPWALAFDVSEPGEHTFRLDAETIADEATGVGEFHRADVFGPAVTDTQLLRARWRPAAVHGGYQSSACPSSRMWVMTTRSMCDATSYSPVTTPFGYYGTSFGADRRSGGSSNFSMWSASRRGQVPPLGRMSHLLAAGSRDAEFSGFGHEGSGVKIRGWTPMPDRPETVVQALRVENDSDYHTYYGYFWDHPTREWKLFAVGRKWSGGKPMAHLRPGSFCEIPGPPHVQRSGDVVREVWRRGWFMGEDGRWHAMDTFACRSKGALNKFWYTTKTGEFAMGTGGMRHYEFQKPTVPVPLQALPEFLGQEQTRQLCKLPAQLGGITPVDVGRTEAVLDMRIAEAGPNARAELHYGQTDSLTFAKRRLHATERGSVVSKSTQQAGRCWSHKVDVGGLRDGTNRVGLDGLKPATTYYCRALVINDDGKVWSFETASFRTAP